ncbi:MAG TPA: DUF1015 family protein [Gammaproteobacteria bacterium]
MHDLVRPFRALRPAPERAAEVAAPPYDVVSRDEAAALAAGKPSSFLRVSRAEIELPPATSPYDAAVYARAAENFRRLARDGVLVRDDAPSYYVYRMTMDGRAQTGVAFVASVAAYEQHRIRRHELTRPDKENDRVRHIEALNAQTGPVLCAYRADAALAALVAEAAAERPLLDVEGPNAVRHSVWRLADPERVARFSAALNALEALYIADGHHRSAAAARVAAERRRGAPAAEASHDYFLTVAFPHDAMRILDYNRVVRDLNGLSPERLLERLAESFAVQRSATPVRPERGGVFGLYAANAWHRLELPENAIPRDDPVAALDVSLLQDRVLGPLLGIGDPRTDPRIDFVGGVRGLAELERRVDAGDAAAAFSLHPTRMEQLMAVADAGRLMPPKSTWFDPKLADGLLSHVLD